MVIVPSLMSSILSWGWDPSTVQPTLWHVPRISFTVPTVTNTTCLHGKVAQISTLKMETATYQTGFVPWTVASLSSLFLWSAPWSGHHCALLKRKPQWTTIHVELCASCYLCTVFNNSPFHTSVFRIRLGKKNCSMSCLKRQRLGVLYSHTEKTTIVTKDTVLHVNNTPGPHVVHFLHNPLALVTCCRADKG